MCGRFVIASSPTLLAERFHVDELAADAPAPDYNVAPRADVPVVRDRRRDDETITRVLSWLRWGLVPPWAKDLAIGDRMINARAETLTTRSAYQRAFARRRCLIPADGFYEWRTLPPPPGSTRPVKEPLFIHRRDGEPLAFAGLWAAWKVPDELVGTVGADDGWLRSCVIVTTTANRLLAPIHDRMPVALPEQAWDTWLDPTPRDDPDDLAPLTRLLGPAPDEWFEAYPVSPRVNRAVENDAELLRPAGAAVLP